MKAKLILGGGMVEVEGTPAELRELLKLDGELLMTISSNPPAPTSEGQLLQSYKTTAQKKKKAPTILQNYKKCRICGEKKSDVKWGRCQDCKKNALGNQKKPKKKKVELGDLSTCKRCGKQKDLSELHRGRCKLGCKPLTKEEEEYETPDAEPQVVELLSTFVQALLERKTPEDQVLMEIKARAKQNGFVILDRTAKRILNRIQKEVDKDG